MTWFFHLPAVHFFVNFSEAVVWVVMDVAAPYYLSPELIQGEEYSYKSDVWAMGVMMYEMLALT